MGPARSPARTAGVGFCGGPAPGSCADGGGWAGRSCLGAAEGEGKGDESEGRESDAELLVGGAAPRDVDGALAAGQLHGDEAVISRGAWIVLDGHRVGAHPSDVPVGVGAEVEDEDFGLWEVEGEVRGGVRGDGLVERDGVVVGVDVGIEFGGGGEGVGRGGVGVGARAEPVAGVVGAEDVVVGVAGRVLVGGGDAVMGSEMLRDGGGAVVGAAGLGVEVEGEEAQGEWEEEGCEVLRERREVPRGRRELDFAGGLRELDCGGVGEGVEEERQGEGEDGGEDGEESPGKLEEGELGEMFPDGRGEREQQAGYEDGEGGERGEDRGEEVRDALAEQEQGEDGGDGEDQEREGERAGSVVDDVVCGVGGAREEEVVLIAHVGDDGHRDLDEAALIGCGEEIEGGQREAEGGSGDTGEGEGFCLQVARAERVEDAQGREESEGVAAHDGGGRVGEPEQRDRDGDGADRRAGAQDGEEKEGNPGGGQELGQGGALECVEEHVGVGEVERGGEQGGVGRDEVAGELVEGEAGGEECDEDEDRRRGGDGEEDGEDGAQHPGERWVEEKARLAGVPCGGEGPARVEGSVAELLGGVEPALDVEDEVVAAGAAVEQQREDREQRGEGEK